MSSSTNQSDERDRVVYDPTTDTYHNQYDWKNPDSLGFTIIMTVSAATGQEATAMEPLYSVLDPDALEALLSHSRGDRVHVSFSYEECTVSVAGGGEIVVQSKK